MASGQYPVLKFGTTHDWKVMMKFIQPPDDAHILRSEQHEFEQWLDQQALSGPQSFSEAVPVEGMEVDQIEDQNVDDNLYSLLENVTFYPEAEEAEAEGQKFMELDQENSDHQDAPIPEDIPPPHANVEVQDAPPEGTCAVTVEQAKRQKRKAIVGGERKQPKRECKERQSRKVAFEQEIKSATLQQRRNRSEIAKEEHRQVRRNTSSRK